MKIIVQMRYDGMTSKATRECMVLAVANAMMPAHLRNTTIVVKFLQHMKLKNCAGLATYRKGRIEIHISKGLTVKSTFETIAHELAHAIQIAEGRLSWKEGRTCWCGQEFARDDLPYYSKREWEQEALAAEAVGLDIYRKISAAAA